MLKNTLDIVKIPPKKLLIYYLILYLLSLNLFYFWKLKMAHPAFYGFLFGFNLGFLIEGVFLSLKVFFARKKASCISCQMVILFSSLLLNLLVIFLIMVQGGSLGSILGFLVAFHEILFLLVFTAFFFRDKDP